MSGFDPYSLLNVERSADESTIRKAYKKASIKCHPDRNPGDGAAEKFVQIKRAHDVLIDDTLRDAYDHGGWGMVERLEEMRKRHENRVSKCPPIIIDNVVTLQQIYNKEKISVSAPVQHVGDDGTVRTEQFSMDIDLAHEGKIVVQGQGHQRPDHVPGDIVIQVRLAPTSEFSLNRDDIVYTAKLDLRNLMGEYTVYIPHPSGKNLKVTGEYLFGQDNTVVFRGLGLRNERAGNLVLQLEIDLEQLETVSDTTRRAIIAALDKQYGKLNELSDSEDITADGRALRNMHGGIPPELAQMLGLVPGMGVGGLPPGVNVVHGNGSGGDCTVM